MPEHSNKSRGQFNSMMFVVMNAKFALWDRETEALNEGNEELANQLYRARRELDEDMNAIRKARTAFLLSDQSMDALIDGLSDAVVGLKNGLKSLNKLEEALNGVAKIIAILARLVDLVS